MIWSVDLSCKTNESDIRFAIPIMLTAYQPFIGKSTGQLRQYNIGVNSPGVIQLRNTLGFVKFTKNLESKKRLGLKEYEVKNDGTIYTGMVIAEDIYKDGELYIKKGTYVGGTHKFTKAKTIQRPGNITIQSKSTTSVYGDNIYVNGLISKDGKPQPKSMRDFEMVVIIFACIPGPNVLDIILAPFLGIKGKKAIIEEGTIMPIEVY